jgi:hypothetical protein
LFFRLSRLFLTSLFVTKYEITQTALYVVMPGTAPPGPLYALGKTADKTPMTPQGKMSGGPKI